MADIAEPYTICWREAVTHSYDELYEQYGGFYLNGINIARPDGSIVWVCYYPRGDRFRARRMRANGKLGASKYYDREDNGWLRAINHRLLSEYRSI